MKYKFIIELELEIESELSNKKASAITLEKVKRVINYFSTNLSTPASILKKIKSITIKRTY